LNKFNIIIAVEGRGIWGNRGIREIGEIGDIRDIGDIRG